MQPPSEPTAKAKEFVCLMGRFVDCLEQHKKEEELLEAKKQEKLAQQQLEAKLQEARSYWPKGRMRMRCMLNSFVVIN